MRNKTSNTSLIKIEIIFYQTELRITFHEPNFFRSVHNLYI